MEKKYWFKRKRYGWGWVPASIEGWLVILVYGAILIALGLSIDESAGPRELVIMFILPLAILSVSLITIAYKTGEPPRWQWGGKDSDSKSEEKVNDPFK